MAATKIDLDSIVAIDVHTHVQASVEAGRGFSDDSPEAAVAKVFGSDALLTVPELAAFYRERNMAAVCFMVDSVRWGPGARRLIGGPRRRGLNVPPNVPALLPGPPAGVPALRAHRRVNAARR